MTKLELMNLIAYGASSFSREEFPDLDGIDRQLRELAEHGYVGKIVRFLSPRRELDRADRVDVIGGLTAVGELRRRQLFPLAMHTDPFFWRGHDPSSGAFATELLKFPGRNRELSGSQAQGSPVTATTQRSAEPYPNWGLNE